MATGDVIIRIRADSRDFQADVERARRQLNNLGGAANQAAGGLHSGASAMGKMKSAMANTAMYGGAAAMLMGLAAIPVKAREAADSYTDIQSKLKLATTSTAELATANERLFAISQSTRTAFADTVQLYSGIALPLKEAGKAQSEILKFTELVSQGLQISGANAGEAASTIRQLSQAMASGVLRGDEFNSLMENNKAIVQALADGLGKRTGELRAMAEAGLLKSEMVFAAVMSQADKMDTKFKQIAPTMEKAWVTVGNTMLLEIGKLDQATGASAAIAKNLMSLGENMDTVFSGAAVAVTLLTASLAGRGVASLTSYTAAKITAASAARALAMADAQASAASAAASVRNAEATLLDATARARRIMLQREDAIATVAATRGTDAYSAALVRLNAAHIANAEAQAASAAARAGLTAATAGATAATNSLSAAQAAATVTGRGMAAASALGSGALALLGGPAGLAMLAGVGMYYFAEANNEAAQSITLANGQTLTFAETMDHVTEISNEYRTASTARQNAIRAEIDDIIKLTNQRKIEAQQQLDYLNQLDAASAAAGAGSPEAFANSVKKGWADFWGLDQSEAKAVIKESAATLETLEKKQDDLGKSAEQLSTELKKTPEAYGEQAKAALASGTATKAASAAVIEAGKVLHDHGDIIKGVVESLTQQRIAIEHGDAAADYYAKRLQGLTDAEARAAVGADQYNTYLAERKKITREAAESAGGLRDKYIANLDAIGLTTGNAATAAIDAAKLSTDNVVAASDKYKLSIDSATEALKRQADAAKAVLAAASNPVVPDAAGTIAAGSVMPSTVGKSDASLAKKMQLAAKLNPATMAAINSVSKSSGLDPTMMKAMAWIESNFNAKAYNKSSASGVYQFVNKTASAYGLSGKQFDPVANTQAYVRLLNDNMKALKQYGLEVNSANLYLAHQQGADGLKQITNEAKGYGRASPKVRENMAGNPSGFAKDNSAAEFLRGWREKFATVEASVHSLGNETAKVAPMFKSGVQGLADEASKVAPLLAKTGTTNLLSGLFPVVGAVADAAKSTFAGVAKESGKIAKDSGIKGVVAEAGKIAPTAAKAIPIWDELGAKTQKINDIAVEYNGTIDQTRMTEEQRNALIDDYMNTQAGGLVKGAEDHLRQIQMTTAEYRLWQLQQDKFSVGDQQRILSAEQQAAYAEELKSLEQERGAIRGTLATEYQQQLEQQNLTQEQMAKLVAGKMSIATEKLVYDAEQHTLQLQSSAKEWRSIELHQQGYNDAQVISIMQAERLSEETERIRSATDQLGNDLLAAFTSAASGAEGAFDGLAASLQKTFSDLVISPTVKPITDAFSTSMTQAISGGSNPWAGLQQQFSQTWAGLQQGGMQGYSNAAGVGAVIGGLTGSQEGAIGGTLGSIAGKALGTALGGPIGGAIGSVIGSAAGAVFGDMLKDDDSARAKFTNGNPTDGFVYRDGNKLSASSVYGTFGFQEDGTHDLGNSAEKEMAAFVARMAAVDNALANFIPAAETDRIKAELTGFEHTGLDFAELFKQRLVIITSGFSATMRGLIDYSADADVIMSRINDLIAIQKEAVPALHNMNMQIGATDDAALVAATGLSDIAGGLQNLTSTASAYYDAVYSEDEQKQIAIRNAKTSVDAFNAANGAQLDSLASLRLYVEGLDLTQSANYQASLAAMGLADELQLLAGTSVSLLDSANAKLQEQQTIFGMFSSGLSKITGGLTRQLGLLGDQYGDQIEHYKASVEQANKLRDAIRGLVTTDLTVLTPADQLAATRAEFERLTKAARGGDLSAASQAESIGMELLKLSREYNASSDTYNLDYKRVEKGLLVVADILSDQRDPQLDMLDAQERLIDQASSQAAQMAAVYGGILGGNTLLSLMGDDINNLPPDLAKALKATLDGFPTDKPTTTTLTVAEYKAKALSETSKLTDPTAQIASLYPLLLDRAGDLAGINYWAGELKSGVALKDIISRMVDAAIANGEWAKVHPNSHAMGLYAVPHDNYAANLHAGEAVVDAASMAAMRKYGIPLQRQADGNSIVVSVNVDALVKQVETLTAKVETLTSEARAMRSERSSDARHAQQQRDSQLHQAGEGARAVTRAVKMRGSK